MPDKLDAIVIGTGGVGSAALYHLAQRGLRVLGLDQFPPAHDQGSSHGQTRIIRQAYFEHADYVPLLLRAYELWHDLEVRSGEQLFFPVGLLEAGPADGTVVPGVMRAAEQHQLPIETLTPSQARIRFPRIRVPHEFQIVFEPTAGYLLVEKCVKTHLRLAGEAGATFRQEEVLSWRVDADQVSVHTRTNRYDADRLVVSAGPWSARLLGDLGISLRVIPKHVYWHAVKHRATGSRASGWPAFFLEMPEGYFYGFPDVAGRGVKVARHSGGDAWDEPRPLADVHDEKDEALVRDFVRACLPGIADVAREHQACLYTLSPDEHFVVDRHPESERVVFAAGLSGHGFKFTSVLGEILADLSTRGKSRLPLDFLRWGRFC